MTLEQRLGPHGRLGVHWMPLADGGGFSYRGEEGFPAASVIKVPIMMEALRQAQLGQLDLESIYALQETDVVGGAGVLMELHRGITLTWRDLVHLMIVVSDNTASNALIDRLGQARLNQALAELGMTQSVLGRKFMVAPDSPLVKNFTSPNDMARCLAALYRNEFLNAEWSSVGIDIMARQQYREKIPLLLPAETRVAHKTGEIDGVRHDVALVLRPGRSYVFVALTHQVADVLEADRVIAELSLLIYSLTQV
jgi:beta-lactamase class A